MRTKIRITIRELQRTKVLTEIGTKVTMRKRKPRRTRKKNQNENKNQKNIENGNKKENIKIMWEPEL